MNTFQWMWMTESSICVCMGTKKVSQLLDILMWPLLSCSLYTSICSMQFLDCVAQNKNMVYRQLADLASNAYSSVSNLFEYLQTMSSTTGCFHTTNMCALYTHTIKFMYNFLTCWWIPKFSANNLCISPIPIQITKCSPFTIIAQLDSSFIFRSPIRQSYCSKCT